jgi:O-antigen/teichoic acid export membrane protein
LLAGGGVFGLLLAQVACAALGAAFVVWMAPRMKVPRLSIRMDTIRDLLRRGRPFLAFGVVQALQPVADASMLSWLGNDSEMGWYGAARKLCGMLVYPAAALLYALYPTLCRLHSEDIRAFRGTTVDALHVVALVAVPVTVGTFMYPELGVGLFGNDSYGPAADNLRVLAPWLLLVYFSMPVGSCLTASGRQTAWTLVLLVGALTSIALDPLLIPWFHRNTGNAGLGVCVAGLVGEIVTLAGALCLLPPGVLSGVSRRRMLAAILSGTAMAAVALVARPLNDWFGAALAVLAYGICMQLCGGLDFRQLRDFVTGLRRQARG